MLNIALLTLAQLLAHGCDNASNNDRMVDDLHKLLPSVLIPGRPSVPALGGKSTRVRCFAHIINLASKVRLMFCNPIWSLIRS